MAQPWSDGKVGTWGGSYVGWSQLGLASQKRKALKAVVPTVAAWFDSPVMYPGGIYSYAFMQAWSMHRYLLGRGSHFPSYPVARITPASSER